MKSFFCWDRIAKIGKQKVVKSSYYWLVIVPILSKVLHGIETPFEFIFSSGYKLELNLELPFSWKIFFISSVLISIANALYFIFCPRLIQEFKNFSEFKNSGKSINVLDRDYISENDEQLKTEICSYLEGNENAHIAFNDNGPRLEIMANDYFSTCFETVWSRLKTYYLIPRSLCIIFYWVGILLFIGVLIQNILFVVNTYILT